MDANRNGWHGMTIKDVIGKVDLANVATICDDGKWKKEKPQSSVITLGSFARLKNEATTLQSPSSAYLGPRLWDKSITIPNLDLENEEEEEEEETSYNDVMNMEDFLAENNIKMDIMQERSPEPIEVNRYSPSAFMGSPESPQSPCEIKPQPRPSIIMAPQNTNSDEPLFQIIYSGAPIEMKKETVLKGENTFLYAESKRAKLEREKEERRRKFEVEVDFAPEDLALATIPGMDFNPKERAFDIDELRPQPIIRKRKKLFVADDSKDDKYWDKRVKNNIAARRSREARRLKENQIALRAAFLEKENKVLQRELDDSQFENTKLATEKDILKMKLSRYESFALHK